jgi:hypothetical protein
MKQSNINKLLRIIADEGLDVVILTRSNQNYIDTFMEQNDKLSQTSKLVKVGQLLSNKIEHVLELSAN